jgi:hypothetical protein
MNNKKTKKVLYGLEPMFTFFYECFRKHELNIPIFENVLEKALIIDS